MGELILIKLGGSIITDKLRAATPRPEVMKRLAGELKAARDVRPELRIVLGHGSGSFGHVPGEKYGVRQGMTDDQSWWGYAAIGAAAAQLNRIVTDTFLWAGVPVVSIQPSASARCRGGKLVGMETYAIREALRRKLVPLVYGDVAFDEEQGCTIVSTEQVLAYLAAELCPARMIIVGEVDGVYDRDPLIDPEAAQIAHITPDTFAQIEARLGGSRGVDVTGGMLSKVREMVSLVARGDTQYVRLVSGWREGVLTRVLIDAGAAEGTLIGRERK